ncbi:prepilin peptidase [Otoolea muris]|uniref:prepilin peptidase n=1 Tax=Otoolea muris TaxID=2941515 RepID=UPI002040A6BB|nr:prepilin peptidase [Otoolea muris]
MDTWKWAAFAACGCLAAMRLWLAGKAFLGKTTSFFPLFLERRFYAALLLGTAAGLAAGGLGISVYALRYADLVFSYLILAVVDGKRREVPDEILLCLLFSQMLYGAAGAPAWELGRIFTGGAVFSACLAGAAFLSEGRIGWGDVKLLAVTAVTAGWPYTVTIAGLGLFASFFYSLWLLLFKKTGGKEEFPFVPFLAAGMLMYAAAPKL